MPSKQIPVQIVGPLREKLSAAASEQGVSLAEIMRRALVAYLTPTPSFTTQLLASLQDPASWPAIRAALEAQLSTAPPPPADPLPPPPRTTPTWSYQRPEGVPPRAQTTPPPPLAADNEHPF